MDYSLSVLTIDDNDSIRLSISSYLEDFGYIIYSADSGESGIEVIKDKKPDVILTDTHMPGLSGIDVLKFVSEYTPKTPIIVISGAGEIEFVVEALRAGAWDYIIKPIEDLNFLIYTIDKVMKRFYLIQENNEKTVEIEKKNKELRSTIEELKTTQSKLVESEKMASLGYMVQGVAHEINTPLGVCLTSISFLKDETQSIIKLNQAREMKLSHFTSFTKNLNDLALVVYESLQNINRLVTNFKQLSNKPEDNVKKYFFISEAISSVILLIKSSYPDLDIELKLSGDNPKVYSYADTINLVFIKLTENSIIHGFKNRTSGKIEVNINSSDGVLYIEFINNGHKISPDVLPHIFDPFFTENKEGGTGLGLCIVYNLVHFTLNGEIECKNIDDGIQFNINFPIDT